MKKYIELKYPDKVISKLCKNIDYSNIDYNLENVLNGYRAIFIKIDLNQNYKIDENLRLKRDIDFIFNKSKDLNIPTIIDANFKIDKKNNLDMTIFDKYINSTYLKKSIRIEEDKSNSKFDLNVLGHENLLEINIFKPLTDDIELQIISPSNVKIKNISSKSRKSKYIIENTKIEVYFNEERNSFKESNISIKLISDNHIELGKWKIVFNPVKVEKGNLDIYLNLDNIGKNTYIKDSKLSILMSSKILKDSQKRDIREFGDEADITEDFIPMFVIDYIEGFEEELKKLDGRFRFYKLADNFGILYINKNRLEDLGEVYRLETANRIQRYVKMAQLTTLSRDTTNGYVANEEIGANFFKNNPNLNIDGRGVIIGVLNSGIDYLHPDFINPDGTSKILYLWDQTVDGKPPNGFTIGTEYTRDDINKAIAEKNPNLSVDEEGIGTALSGLCAGMGNVNREYSGVAEGSDLVVVKLKKINGYYNSAMHQIANRYIYEKAEDERKPVVQLISMGSNNSIIRGIDLIVDSLFYEYGLCEVIAAGNEGSGMTHTMGKIEFVGDSEDIVFEIVEEEKDLEIDIWIDKPDKASVEVISPSGEPSKEALISNFNFVSGLFDRENTYYSIWSTYPASYLGQQQTVIRLEGAKKGMWTIRLTGEYITNGIYHVYLPVRSLLNEGTKFIEGNPSYTITYPSTYQDTISIGVYNSIENSLWPYSSRGPIAGATGRIEEPDIIAPGVNIIAPYTNSQYATVTGSGAAAALSTGAIALMMQYALVDKNYKDKAVVQKLRTYMRAGAKRNIQITYPNISYGYGILDIKGMFDQLK
jgi:subtilisin family serine protease